MMLKYSSSNGQTFDLKVGKFRTRTANYHTYKWKPQAISQRYGVRPYRFDKDAIEYETLMTVFGTLEEKKTFLNILHAAFEHDIFTMTPGRITHGLYYIECFITSVSTYYDDPWTQNLLAIYCPYPFWRKDIEYVLHAAEADEYEYLDFPYGFPYYYQAPLPGYSMITNPGVKAADWQLTINGYAPNPYVVIGDMAVGVNATIGSEERLVISSREKTVTKYAANGVAENLFNQRIKGSSIFEPLPSGELPVMWSGTFDIDLAVYEERSEPLWI